VVNCRTQTVLFDTGCYPFETIQCLLDS